MRISDHGHLRVIAYVGVSLFPAMGIAQAPAAQVVYRCPGNVYTSDREITAAQANQRGCKPLDDQPVTIVPAPRPRPANGAAPASGVRPAEGRVDPAAQRARDSDARRILTDELKREEDRLAVMQREYNNGEPERTGEERNYQRYIDRVAELKAAIARKESDISALKREMAKLPL